MNVLDLKGDKGIFFLISSMIYSENKWKPEGYMQGFSPPIFPSILLGPNLKNPCTEESSRGRCVSFYTVGGA